MTDYPLVWWIKKALPHRKGQRCKRASYAQLYEDLADRRKWMGEDIMCFEFEDGTEDWGPKHGARRPDRTFRDDLCHETDNCTGEWVRAKGDYVCPKCETWVRASPEIDREVQQSWSRDHATKAAFRAGMWSRLIERARDGIDPLDFARSLIDVRRDIRYDRSFEDAMKDHGVEVNPTSKAS